MLASCPVDVFAAVSWSRLTPSTVLNKETWMIHLSRIVTGVLYFHSSQLQQRARPVLRQQLPP